MRRCVTCRKPGWRAAHGRGRLSGHRAGVHHPPGRRAGRRERAEDVQADLHGCRGRGRLDAARVADLVRQLDEPSQGQRRGNLPPGRARLRHTPSRRSSRAPHRPGLRGTGRNPVAILRGRPDRAGAVRRRSCLTALLPVRACPAPGSLGYEGLGSGGLPRASAELSAWPGGSGSLGRQRSLRAAVSPHRPLAPGPNFFESCHSSWSPGTRRPSARPGRSGRIPRPGWCPWRGGAW